MSSDNLLDVEKTLEALGGDRTLLAKVAQMFVRSAPELIEHIGTALAAEDLKRAYADAHSLKGAVGVFGAPQVLESVDELARNARAGDLPATAHAFAAAHPLVVRLLTEVEPLLAPCASAARSRGR